MSTDKINAMPTKSFFVEMLTRDISLEQAVLDLVDNSVDGLKRAKAAGETRNFKVEIELSRDAFVIRDNCGGFSKDVAREYAFRFGRPAGAAATPHSIGQFGVGMKRALFKFGRRFSVTSATVDEEWSISVDVDEWERLEPWTFPWGELPDAAGVSSENPGTEIRVVNLRPEVSTKFATDSFQNGLVASIRSKHRQFISEGLSIVVNETHVSATSLTLLMGSNISPAKALLTFGSGSKKVTARIAVGIGPSSPKEAGWYVVCNGRVILEADRREVTGWGLVEESTTRVMIPSFHNQFARFRGVVFFDSEDSSRVPWNTTKTDVDQDSEVWRGAFERMLELMRPVISFLNELDRDIDENTREESALLEVVQRESTGRVSAEMIDKSASFQAPSRESLGTRTRTVKIQYSRPLDDVQFLQEERGLASAKAVGEASFDEMLERQRAE